MIKKYSYFIFLFLNLFILSLYWTSYFPCCMSEDSQVQWWEAHHLNYLTDWHPFLYTLFIRLLSFIWNSPSILILFNILLYSIIFSAILNYFYKKGMNFLLLASISILVTIIPTNGRMMVTFWKDITYSAGMLWLSFIIVKLVMERQADTPKTQVFSELFLALAIILFSRHNGIVVVLGSLIVVSYFFRSNIKKYLFFSSIFLASFFGLKTTLFRFFKVEEGWYTVEHAMVRHLAYYLVKQKLNDSEKAVLLKIMPEEVWIKQYNPWTHDTYAFGDHKDLYRKNVNQYKSEIRSLFFKKILNDPLPFLQSEKNITELLWRPIPSANSYRNEYCKTCGKGLNNKTRIILDRFTAFSDNVKKPYYMPLLFWSGAMNIIIYFAVFLFLIIRRKFIYAIVFLPDLFNTLSLVIANTAQDFRYVYCSFIIFPLILLFLFYLLIIRKKKYTNNQLNFLTAKNKIKIIHFHNGKGGGVLSVIRNLLVYRQHEEIENHVIYTINRDQIKKFILPGLKGAYREQVFYYSPNWNFYYTCKQLVKLLPDDKAVVVAHDWLELGMVSHLGLSNPVVLILHGNYDYYYNLAIAHEKNIDFFICIARSIQEKLRELLQNRTADIYYQRFPVNEPVKKRSQGCIQKAVFIGRCENAKGYQLLPAIDIELSRLNCHLEWIVIGAGSLTRDNQLIWPQSSKVSFLGELSNEEVLVMLSEFDLIVLPSIAEGMPVAVIEAMKAGVIPIVNDLPGGLQELVINGVTGYRVPGNHPVQYAAKIRELMKNVTHAQTISAACIKTSFEMFNAGKNTLDFEALFIRIIKHRKLKTSKKVYGSSLDKRWIPNIVVYYYRTIFGRKKNNYL